MIIGSVLESYKDLVPHEIELKIQKIAGIIRTNNVFVAYPDSAEHVSEARHYAHGLGGTHIPVAELSFNSHIKLRDPARIVRQIREGVIRPNYGNCDVMIMLSRKYFWAQVLGFHGLKVYFPGLDLKTQVPPKAGCFLYSDGEKVFEI